VNSVTFAHEDRAHRDLLAILDDDKSVQRTMQNLIESEGMCVLCFDLQSNS
jgi:FixJ family two-component response regulator